MIITSSGFNPNFLKDWYFQEGLSRVNSIFGDVTVTKILFAHNRYYAFGASGSRIAFSTDLQNWTIVDLSAWPGLAFNDAAVSSTGVILVIAGTSILRSSNGIEWENLSGFQFANSIACNNGSTFVIGGGYSGAANFALRSTTNGTSWTDVSVSAQTALGSGVSPAPITKVQFKNGLFFMSGTSNSTAGNPRVISSPDGTTWTTRFNWTSATSSFGAAATGIEWTGSVYLVYGNQGIIATAPSSFASWTAQTALSTTTWGVNAVTEILWNGSRMIAIGASGRIALSTSATAAAWTYVTDGATSLWASRPIYSVMWDGSQFLISGGTAGGTGTALLAASTTGADTTWTFNNSLWKTGEFFGTITVNAFEKCNGVYVAGGTSGIAYSPDASSWTISTSARTAFPAGNTVSTIATNGSIFVAGSNGGRIATSSDGVNWTYQAQLSTTAWGGTNIVQIIWNGTKFLAIGSAAQAVATSTDGSTWTFQTGLRTAWGTGSNTIPGGVVWSGTQFVVSATSSSTATASLGFATSPDGVTWTSRPYSANGTGGYTRIAFDGSSRYIAISGFGGKCATSTDGGVNWSNARGSGTTSYSNFVGTGGGSNMSDIIYVPAVGWFVTGGTSAFGNPSLLFSANGTTWSNLVTSVIPNAVTKVFGSVGLTKMLWDSNRLIVTGEKAQVITQRAV
jgi:hypothetical protein